MIPTRTTVQVKTHAQMVLKHIELGEDVFAELVEETTVGKMENNTQQTILDQKHLSAMEGCIVRHVSKTRTLVSMAACITITPRDLAAAVVLTELRRDVSEIY